nr:serine/arginine-rich splicing factor 11-like [Arachis hypogaea]
MEDIPEDNPSNQDDSQPRRPVSEHREATNQAKIASTIHHANEHVTTDPQHPEKTRDKAAQIIQELCLRVQELEGKLNDGEKQNNGSHATSRSRSHRGRSSARQRNRRDDRSASRNRRREKSPERRYDKKHHRNASRDLNRQHDSDEDRRYRSTKRTRSDHTIMGATPFT